MMDHNDMVTRPHPDPKYHTRMPMENRAAQFAPFAALTGYDEAVAEAHRLTEHRPELSEEEKDALDWGLRQALEEKAAGDGRRGEDPPGRGPGPADRKGIMGKRRRLLSPIFRGKEFAFYGKYHTQHRKPHGAHTGSDG